LVFIAGYCGYCPYDKKSGSKTEGDKEYVIHVCSVGAINRVEVFALFRFSSGRAVYAETLMQI
jgi:hypothetical protein